MSDSIDFNIAEGTPVILIVKESILYKGGTAVGFFYTDWNNKRITGADFLLASKRREEWGVWDGGFGRGYKKEQIIFLRKLDLQELMGVVR